jgi:hypothetical protein
MRAVRAGRLRARYPEVKELRTFASGDRTVRARRSAASLRLTRAVQGPSDACQRRGRDGRRARGRVTAHRQKMLEEKRLRAGSRAAASEQTETQAGQAAPMYLAIAVKASRARSWETSSRKVANRSSPSDG